MTSIIIQDGQIVTEERQYQANIRIEGEKIVEISKDLSIQTDEDRIIDASGLKILPGGIDPHVHLSLPEYVPETYRWADDFESGSKAALAGGIISVAIVRKDYSGNKFQKVLLDVSDLVLLSVLILFVAALLEVFVTPALL